MKRILLFLALVSSALAAKKPDIILVMTDDQGYGPVGKHGTPGTGATPTASASKRSVPTSATKSTSPAKIASPKKTSPPPANSRKTNSSVKIIQAVAPVPDNLGAVRSIPPLDEHSVTITDENNHFIEVSLDWTF